MTSLVLADHDNTTLRDATARAVGAALKLDDDVHVLVAGAACRAAAEAAARLAGVRKVLIADAPAYDHLLAEHGRGARRVARAPRTARCWRLPPRSAATSCRAWPRC
jgi:electron transfer flavoprotein alpha subunit